jgi:hypothetical protein
VRVTGKRRKFAPDDTETPHRGKINPARLSTVGAFQLLRCLSAGQKGQ